MLAVGPSAFADDPEIPPEPREPPALPEVPPGSVLVEELTVDSRSETGTDTTAPLVMGQTYLIEASGVAAYGLGDADPECATFGATDPAYERERFPTEPHTVDLVIDLAGLEWVAETPDAENCDTTAHEYHAFLVPESTKRVNFLFKDGGWRGDNSGAFSVRIFRVEAVSPAGALVNSFTFSSANPGGGNSGVALSAVRSYRLRIAGDFIYSGNNWHDAECAYLREDTAGVRQDGPRASGVGTGVDDMADTPDVVVDGRQVDWVPIQGRTGCDDETHTYIVEINGTANPVNLRVRDSWHGDNTGLLSVEVYELGPAAEPSSRIAGVEVPSVENPQDVITEAGTGAVFVEEVTVDSREPTPKSTTTVLAAGQVYVFEASGVVRFGAGQADAECANFDILPTFRREYFTTEPHTADLLVKGVGREWTALVPDTEGCNTTDHTYRTFLVPPVSERASFVFNDGGYRGDNSGQFSVRVFVTDEVPPVGTQIDHFGFDASDADGATSTAVLGENTSYRIQAAGLYKFSGSGRSDPECTYSADGGPGARGDAPRTGLDASLGTPDVTVNQAEVSWVPVRGRSGCDDRSHSYILETAGLSGPVNLRVRDSWHGDNSGLVEVRIFEIGPAPNTETAPLPLQPPEGVPAPPDPNDVDSSAVLVADFGVDSRSDTGTDSPVPLAAGEKYIVQTEGVVQFGAGNADAECANFAPLQPLYKREWFTAAPHTADVVIDGLGREWAATTPDVEGCDTSDHVYTLFFQPDETRRYNFKFNDGGYRGDNAGSFRVRVFLTDRTMDEGTQVDQFGFSSADSDGHTSSVSLLTDHTYRIKISGSFRFGQAGATHDAECVRIGAAAGESQQELDGSSGSPDVIVNGAEVVWRPAQGRGRCDDATNTYTYTVSGVSGTVNLRVRDSWHGDNDGNLLVRIFDLGAA